MRPPCRCLALLLLLVATLGLAACAGKPTNTEPMPSDSEGPVAYGRLSVSLDYIDAK